jgi:hypothetical protein
MVDQKGIDMKTKIVILIALTMGITSGYSQEKLSKKEKKQFRLQEIENLVNSKSFVFVAKTAMPIGMRPVNLSLDWNYVRFRPELIDSYLPFYGNAYSGVGYSSLDNGIKFTAKPESFTTERNKKSYQVSATVNTENENYRLSLQIGTEGNASLTVTSHNRSTISFMGELRPVEYR